MRPAFLVTIDAEGDNIWSNPREVTTENSRHIPRFQALCEKYGFKPTYLTNHEMATCDHFVGFAKEAIGRSAAEVGLHIHAWNSPPVSGGPSRRGMPYLIEFADEVIAEKVRFMTGLLEERFGKRIVSHRAGRWAMNEVYANSILENGYLVDCSVTPFVSWRRVKGFEDGSGGSDYRHFPREPYFIDPADISRPGTSPLLEIPMTIAADESLAGRWVRSFGETMPRPIAKAAGWLFPTRWFRPTGRNLGSMRRLLAERRDSAYIQFMLHSSELMAGGSPTFPNQQSIERLYEHLDRIFEEAAGHYRGATLSEFRAGFELA